MPELEDINHIVTQVPVYEKVIENIRQKLLISGNIEGIDSEVMLSFWIVTVKGIYWIRFIQMLSEADRELIVSPFYTSAPYVESGRCCVDG